MAIASFSNIQRNHVTRLGKKVDKKSNPGNLNKSLTKVVG